MKKKNLNGILEGKKIIINGSSSGIGRSVALSYAKAGAKLILLSRNINDLESLYNIIVKSNFKEPYIYPFDLLHSSWDKYEKLVNVIKKEFKYIDGLVSNAGILGKLSPIECFDVKQWYKVMQVNLNSNFMLTKSFIPLLKISGKSVVIFTTSDNTNLPKSFWGAYSVSKSGLNNLAQILSMENKSITFHCIDPGKVNTKLRRNAFPMDKLNDINKPYNISHHFLYLMNLKKKSYNYDVYNI